MSNVIHAFPKECIRHIMKAMRATRTKLGSSGPPPVKRTHV